MPKHSTSKQIVGMLAELPAAKRLRTPGKGAGNSGPLKQHRDRQSGSTTVAAAAKYDPFNRHVQNPTKNFCKHRKHAFRRSFHVESCDLAKKRWTTGKCLPLRAPKVWSTTSCLAHCIWLSLIAYLASQSAARKLSSWHTSLGLQDFHLVPSHRELQAAPSNQLRSKDSVSAVSSRTPVALEAASTDLSRWGRISSPRAATS